MFVQILVLFIVAIGLAAFYIKRPSARVAHIPGFDGFTSFTRRNTLRDDTLKLTLKTKSKWVRHRILGIDFIYATHPDSAKFLLSNPELFPKADLSLISEAMKDLFSKNLVQLNGDEWKQQRKAINPAFHFDTIKEFVPSFYNKTEQMMQIWKNLPNRNVTVTEWLHKFTLDVLGDTVFGHDFNSLSGEGENHFESYNRIIGYFSKPKNLILSLIEMKLGLKFQFQLYDAVKDLRSMCEGIISEKMEQKRLGTKPTKGHYDIVDMMLDAEPKMDLQALVANIFIFFLAGHETTASALAWQFYYLGNYPQVQQKAREEVDRVIQGRPIKHEMLKELQYLSCVIKEGLRINPPAALIATRYVAEDTEFEGVTIPKGCRIGLAHETIHHLPEFWQQPEVFNPDRFLKENWLSTEGDEHHLKQHPFAYLPFSLKSRACIGNQFSLIEQMVFLASLLHHFEFKTKEIEWPTGSQALVKPDKVVVELNSRT